LFTITKTFEFSAAHQLDGLPPEHQCARLHGHNYRVTVAFTAAGLTAEGWVRDYGDLSPINLWLNETMDHRNLNDLPMFKGKQTTAEVMAMLIYRHVATRYTSVTWVEVSETPKTTARYSWSPDA